MVSGSFILNGNLFFENSKLIAASLVIKNSVIIELPKASIRIELTEVQGTWISKATGKLPLIGILC